MIHLTPADYRVMPWANGKGMTTELARRDRDGELLWRLSRAAVVEDGPFSLFPGLNRNLTVITGPGFDLVSADLRLSARLFQPVSFAGGLAIRAEGIAAPSDDFNVMAATHLPPPIVEVTSAPSLLQPRPSGMIAVYALEQMVVGDLAIQPGDLILCRDTTPKGPGLAIVVHIVEGGIVEGGAA